jgi:membrane protease YdiL (CAAX protease family)
MSEPPAAPSPVQETGLIAPAWHTAVLIVFMLGMAALSAWRGALSPVGNVTSHARLANYAIVLVWEWAAVAFIAWGVRRRGHQLKSLIGGAWPRPSAFFRDLGIAIVFLLCSVVILGAIQFALKSRPNQTVRNLLPQTAEEIAAWILLAATAGFCEEAIFRGYLQQQLGRMARNSDAGLVLQAVIFGACHSYQGWKQTISITVYGMLFGWLAQRLRSLRPGMVAHFLQDSVGGLALREAIKRMPAR